MRKIVTISALIILLLFSSCSSLSVWVKSNLEGVPTWIYEPPKNKSQLSFVGVGEASTVNRSRLLSYESILKQISAFIGEDVINSHITQLSTRQAIDEYRLKVTQEFVKTTEQGVIYYHLAVADRELLEQERSSFSVTLLEKEAKISTYNTLASQYYRENRDLLAFKQYIEILSISSSMPSESGQQWYKESANRARSILQNLSVTLSEGDRSLPSTVVTVRRVRRTFKPRIIGASIVAHPIAKDGVGNLYKDSQLFVTDNQGQITYTSTNPSIVGEGSVEFKLDIDEQLTLLKEIDETLYEEFSQIVLSKVVSYEYKRVSLYAQTPLILALGEFSIQGERLVSHYASEAMATNLLEANIESRPFYLVVSEDENYLGTIHSHYPLSRYGVVGSVGISFEKQLSTDYSVSVTGEVSLVNMATQSTIGSTSLVVANAVASSKEEAQREAFTKFGTLATSLLLRFLYPN